MEPIVYCEGKAYNGKPCIYRAVCKEKNLCGVHKFIGNDLNELQLILPFMFIKPKYSIKKKIN